MAEHSDPHWMEHAVKHPGALTAAAKRAHETLSQFESKHHDNPTTEKRIALAKAFKKANKNRGN